MLTHLFSPDACAHCRLCCNFHRRTAWETPALEPEAVDRLRKMNVPLTKHANGADTIALPFHTDDPEEVALCPLLDTSRGCTLPREERPFECRIWPLRLMHDTDGTLLIGCYDACPALTPDVQESLHAFATGDLLPQLLQFAKDNPKAIRPLDPAYHIVWRAPSKSPVSALQGRAAPREDG